MRFATLTFLLIAAGLLAWAGNARGDDAATTAPAATAPAAGDAAAAAPARALTDDELKEQLTGVERELGAEQRKFQHQMDVLQKVKNEAVANGYGDAVEQSSQAMDDEKTRHTERLADLGARWADISAELESRHPTAGAGADSQDAAK